MEPSDRTSPFVQVIVNSDGSLTRPPVPLCPPSSNSGGPVLSKDVPLNPSHDTWIRIYLPLPQDDNHHLLPIVMFYHGGGFILFSAATAPYHVFCENLARELPALVVSVEYRLAPEHPLPAAYDDAVDAIRWLALQAKIVTAASSSDVGEVEQPDDFLRRADFSRCYLMGSSSGANIVYHAGLRVEEEELHPLQVAGHVYNQPYFGGVEKKRSELEMEDDWLLPLRASDMMWGLSLPRGADMDHEFCNPVKNKTTTTKTAADEKGGILVSGGRLPKRCLVRGNTEDPLIDRQREFAEMLEGEGVSVVARLDQDGHHAVELFDPNKERDMFDDVRNFINKTN